MKFGKVAWLAQSHLPSGNGSGARNRASCLQDHCLSLLSVTTCLALSFAAVLGHLRSRIQRTSSVLQSPPHPQANSGPHAFHVGNGMMLHFTTFMPSMSYFWVVYFPEPQRLFSLWQWLKQPALIYPVHPPGCKVKPVSWAPEGR